MFLLCKKSCDKALEFLKSVGADLNLARVDGATALDLALDQEHSETDLCLKHCLCFCFNNSTRETTSFFGSVPHCARATEAAWLEQNGVARVLA